MSYLSFYLELVSIINICRLLPIITESKFKVSDESSTSGRQTLADKTICEIGPPPWGPEKEFVFLIRRRKIVYWYFLLKSKNSWKCMRTKVNVKLFLLVFRCTAFSRNWRRYTTKENTRKKEMKLSVIFLFSFYKTKFQTALYIIPHKMSVILQDLIWIWEISLQF